MLNFARAFLAWRKTQPALVEGAIAFVDAPEPVLAFERTHGDARVLAVFNLSPEPVDWRLPDALAPHGWLDIGTQPARAADDARVIRLPPHAACFARR